MRRYSEDNRFIPTPGAESRGLELVPDSTSFQVQNGNVSLSNGSEGVVSLGEYFQYLVESV